MSVLLLVEGRQDAELLLHLIEKAKIGSCSRHSSQNSADFVVKVLGSYAQLRRDLPDELLSTAFNQFGIIPDADTDVTARWQSITSRLSEIEERSSKLFELLPRGPDPDGTILQAATGRTIGIWLWPDNRSTGDLEAFAGKLTPQDDPLWIHAGRVIEDLPERRFIPTHWNKAHIHAWLAWQDPPDQTIGIAIAKGNLQIDRDPATRLVHWLTKLKETTP
ncbi:MAG: DUF3226 domain-containing protein [Bryobacteraceae bacterium]